MIELFATASTAARKAWGAAQSAAADSPPSGRQVPSPTGDSHGDESDGGDSGGGGGGGDDGDGNGGDGAGGGGAGEAGGGSGGSGGPPGGLQEATAAAEADARYNALCLKVRFSIGLCCRRTATALALIVRSPLAHCSLSARSRIADG